MRAALAINASLFSPGLRLAVGVSGGADSVALLRALHAEAPQLGLVLHVAHLHHGLRGQEADADLAFVRDLAAQLQLPFHYHHVDTAAEAAPRAAKSGEPGNPANSPKPAESIEQAARRLRYHWFNQLLTLIPLDAVATAHTRDDQAETVLAKILRGAWTEGLSAIHPILQSPPGRILRPLLAVPRADIETYLHAIHQPWREDSTNAQLTFTRNRIRHELLPQLEAWNPQIRAHLAHTAELARDEEAFWDAETARAAAPLILHGRPVRGGGRATGADEDLALDLRKFAELPAALQRRVLRFAAARLSNAPDFPATEAIRALALSGRAGQRSELAAGLIAERTHRELRLFIQPSAGQATNLTPIEIPIPGETLAPAYGFLVRAAHDGPLPAPAATLRPWKPGDRVRLQHSSGDRKVKEVLERMKVSGAERARWPVIQWNGQIIWMQGVRVEPLPGLHITVDPASPS